MKQAILLREFSVRVSSTIELSKMTRLSKEIIQKVRLYGIVLHLGPVPLILELASSRSSY